MQQSYKRENEIARLSLYNTLILTNMKSGIITFDLEGRITTINPSAEKILSIEGVFKNDGEPSEITLPEEFSGFVSEGLENERDKVSGEIPVKMDKDEKSYQRPSPPYVQRE